MLLGQVPHSLNNRGWDFESWSSEQRMTASSHRQANDWNGIQLGWRRETVAHEWKCWVGIRSNRTAWIWLYSKKVSQLCMKPWNGVVNGEERKVPTSNYTGEILTLTWGRQVALNIVWLSEIKEREEEGDELGVGWRKR